MTEAEKQELQEARAAYDDVCKGWKQVHSLWVAAYAAIDHANAELKKAQTAQHQLDAAHHETWQRLQKLETKYKALEEGAKK